MKADPEKQYMNGMYDVNEMDRSNIMALRASSENMEESLKMANHNGQASYREKADTVRQMHAYKDAISKFQNHVNFVERENQVLKRQIANFARTPNGGDGVLHDHLHQTPMLAMRDHGQLEDIRSTCIMLSERIKRMEEQNSMLLMTAEKQRCDYERCLDRVSSQVFQTLAGQRRLQMECDTLRVQVRNMIAISPSPGSSRSSEPSPNVQPNRSGIADEAFDVFNYRNFTQASPNSPRNAFHNEFAQFPYQRQGFVPPAPPENRSPMSVYPPPAAAVENTFPGYAEHYYPHHDIEFNVVSPQCDSQPIMHRTQPTKSPHLQMIPEAIEPPITASSHGDLRNMNGRELLVRGANFPNSMSQRVSQDDAIIGRVSRSRDRQTPAERNKVARSRSFDEHSKMPANHIKRSGMPGTDGRLRPQSEANTPQYKRQMPPPYKRDPVVNRQHIPQNIPPEKQLQERISNPENQAERISHSSESTTNTPQGNTEKPVLLSAPSDPQLRSNDAIWLPRDSNEPSSLHLTENDHHKDHKLENLPPPPPPPPQEEVATKEPPYENVPLIIADVKEEKTDIQPKRDSYSEACNEPLELQDKDRQNKNGVDQQQVGSRLENSFPVRESRRNEIAGNQIQDEKRPHQSAPPKPVAQLPSPMTVLPKKTKREAPRPPVLKPPNVKEIMNERQDVGKRISPSVSCEAISSPPTSLNIKEHPRRLSEGMLKNTHKASRLSAPQKRGSKTKSHSPPTPRHRIAENFANSAEHNFQRGDIGVLRSVANQQNSSTHVSPIDHNTTNNNNLRPPSKISHPSTKIAEESASKGPGSKSQSKAENKKSNGSQKSFVGMMKSKFGVRSSVSKKAAATANQDSKRHNSSETSPVITPTSSLIDPRTLSLEPNSYPPENDGKKISRIALEHEFVGRKLSRPFTNPETRNPSHNKPEVSSKASFLNKRNSKRSKIGRSFENSEHFNNRPYGRVELIPVSSLAGLQSEITNEQRGVDDEDLTPTEMNGNMGLQNNQDEVFTPGNRERNDYENVVLLSNRANSTGNAADLSLHNYENVVIINSGKKHGEVSDIDNQQKFNTADGKEKGHAAHQDKTNTSERLRDKLEVPKERSSLQRIWNSLSNHNLSKLSSNDSGSRSTLNEDGKGGGLSGSLTSEKSGRSYSSEQKMFEKAFISSVVEAQLNSSTLSGSDSGSPQGNKDDQKSQSNTAVSVPDLSPILTEKSSVSFSTTDSSKSANSGFDSWPSKSTGADVTDENFPGGSLDARFRDGKLSDDRNGALKKKSIVDSRSSLGSFGYGSGLSESSTVSSNKSGARSPSIKNLEEADKSPTRDSSSDNDLSPVPQPSSLQSRYAARKFASPIGGAQCTRLQKSETVPKPREEIHGSRLRMGVSSITPPKSRYTDMKKSSHADNPKKKLPTLTCDGNEKRDSYLPHISKGVDSRKLVDSSIPGPSRFGLQRTNIPPHYYGSRIKQTK